MVLFQKTEKFVNYLKDYASKVGKSDLADIDDKLFSSSRPNYGM